MDFHKETLGERTGRFRNYLSIEDRHRFKMRDSDTIEDTVMALVTEVIELRRRLDENSGS